ncbi:LacI family DNA-binding transcriptional regulator [Glycomyces algeriensis]|uniref:LacI family transcriptional regulator n=1 Tax=Glycomyces algeriensis TaxID=256037 RepID=A0A9W6GAA2_9ACTN|nr:LacI family DNA-binding transcriptional regulator [Glycomyces algeriensis]MDA1364401.1 LacI family DNA-binding transcriptional regulator [Glycomyces algeriensis]MDR7350434.1 LacI family transcriptional regulator [Glycomyces algeriensis]GLI43142.1 LacI family transcriptional regulator [Glycomyces algeriensis]
MAKRVTIHDVAAEAGVSRQTVTRAMNDRDDIKEATRLRVLEAVERLGYRPSRFARNLVTRRKQHALGLVVASFDNPYYTGIAAEMLTAAAERGWQLMMAAAQDDTEAVLGMLASQADVVALHFGGSGAELSEFAGGLPVVRLEAESLLPGVHSVALDIESGIVAVVAELRARGARRFGMVDSAHSLQAHGARGAGGGYGPSPKRRYFERAVGEPLAGVTIGDESIAAGSRAFGELLEQHPDVDTVLMFNDLMALGAVRYAQSRGIDVPGRVRIVGIDGLALGEAVHPRLTSIALDVRAMASHTMDIAELVAKADFARLDPIHRRVGSSILWRESA